MSVSCKSVIDDLIFFVAIKDIRTKHISHVTHKCERVSVAVSVTLSEKFDFLLLKA